MRVSLFFLLPTRLSFRQAANSALTKIFTKISQLDGEKKIFKKLQLYQRSRDVPSMKNWKKILFLNSYLQLKSMGSFEQDNPKLVCISNHACTKPQVFLQVLKDKWSWPDFGHSIFFVLKTYLSHLYMHAETGLWIIESKLVKCLAAVADLSNRCSIFLLNSFLGLDITLLPWCSLLESFRILSLQSQRYSDMSAWTLLNSWGSNTNVTFDLRLEKKLILQISD